MSTPAAILLFTASLALSIGSSLVLATAVDRLGVRLGVSEGLLGIATALAADAPEIAAAVTALSHGSRDLGVGVVLGSSIFNIAALLGLSAVVAGRVSIRPRGLLFNGATAIAVAVVALLLVLGVLNAVIAIILLAALLIPYVLLSSQRSEQIERRVPAGPVARFLALALAEEEQDLRSGEEARRADRQDVLTLVPALVSVVLASIGLVNSATTLAGRAGVSEAIVGTLVLAALTGIPNVIAAVRLARRGRGSAVVSEAFNSNTFNLLVGLVLPALLIGLGKVSRIGVISAAWLLAVTALASGLTLFRGGLRRYEGAAVIAAYLVFVALVIS